MNYINSIQESINYIEENLSDDLNLDLLAAKTFCSKFHFLRLFQALVGCSVGQYIKRRRFSFIAKALLETDVTITKIALEYGFNSHAVFDRAFKNNFGISPAKFRKSRNQFDFFEKVNLNERKFEKNKAFFTGPVIISLPSMCFIGAKTKGTFNDNYKNMTVNKFWWKFLNEEWKIENKVDPAKAYGISYESAYKDVFNYFAAFEVNCIDAIPDNMDFMKIPAGNYAVFTLTEANNIENFYKALDYIYGVWLTNSEYELANHIDLIEVLNQAYKDGIINSYDLYIPIK
jgi:AraC family transcriptional regulator